MSAEPSRRGFEWYDYVIFVGILAISLGIGVYSALTGRGSNPRQYMTGNRKLKVIPTSLSMFMSFISAVLVMGNTAETYLYGPMQWMAGVGNSLANIFVVVFLVPLFYPLKYTSSFQYLELRYKSKAVRRTGSILLILSGLIYNGIAMYAPATALDSVLGFPTWASIVATGIVATIYTSIGGISAVVWTDAFQAVVYLAGIVVILIIGSVKLNGFGNIWNINMEHGRIDTWDFTFNPMVRISFWSVLVGRFVASISNSGTTQTAYQRYCSLPTMRGANWSILLNIPLFIMIYTLTCMLGFVVFAFYQDQGCDPIRSLQISNANQLLPYFIVEGLQLPGLSGLFVAILFSGCLSTVSSAMNSISTVVWKDFLEWKFHGLSERGRTIIIKLLVVVAGGLSIGMAFMAQILGGHVLEAAQGFASGVAGPTVGLFLLGAFFPCANWIGGLAGAWLGLAICMAVTIGSYVEVPYQEFLNTTVENCQALGYNDTIPMPTNPPDVNPFFKMSFMWFAPLGTMTCIVVGLVVSILTKNIAGPESLSDHDPRLIIPVFDRIMCCLPERWLKRLRCGIPFNEIKHGKDEDEQDNEMQENSGFDEKQIGSKEEGIGYSPDKMNGDAPPAYSSQFFKNDGFTMDEDNVTRLRL